ncbi:hypothetical protein EA796_22630 [Pseudomonas sp. AOB-7]|uniref:hypothetical protein n=1 Tax=Pseudomonas sp. AOB-7 TaxID=2482750 RepID=UPI000EFB1DC6|nr:hypothetical protein [Pseudomonas sp. AOB-7]RMH81795.1 hypothetical protein EA796_22630 [Pseudomonas sp. AOB-7]
MSHVNRLFVLCAGLGLCVSPALADSADWQIAASSYMWFPKTESSVETSLGTVSSDLSARDALDALDVGVMLGVSAQRGPWSLLGDLFYLDLSFQERTPFGRVFSAVDTRTTVLSVAGYGLYNLYDRDGLVLDAGLGLRMLSSDIEVTLQGVALNDRDTSASDTWVDPLFALRASAHLGQRWRAVVLADAGGFGIDKASDRTWQIVTVLTYRIGESWSASGGYRHLYFDRENDGVPYELEMSGPLLGVSYRF